MKVFLCIYIALCLLAIAYAGDELSPQFKEKLIAKVQQVGLKCAAEAEADGDDIGELMQRKTPTRKQGKCLLYCFDRELGFIGEDNKFSKEGIAKGLANVKKENEAIYNKAVKLMEDCLPSVKSSDHCEAAAEMAHCANLNADKAGITADLII